MFATFIERGFCLIKKNGYSAMITMQSWMFLSSYEKLRIKLNEKSFPNFVNPSIRSRNDLEFRIIPLPINVIVPKSPENSAHKNVPLSLTVETQGPTIKGSTYKLPTKRLKRDLFLIETNAFYSFKNATTSATSFAVSPKAW